MVARSLKVKKVKTMAVVHVNKTVVTVNAITVVHVLTDVKTNPQLHQKLKRLVSKQNLFQLLKYLILPRLSQKLVPTLAATK